MSHEHTEQTDTATRQTDHPTDRRAMLAGIGGLAAGAFLASKATAGPLNPPTGPIAPTPGPEPRIAINQTNTPGSATAIFRITQPGSYYLEGDIVGSPGIRAIVVLAEAGEVTIDLNGFTIRGLGGAFAIVCDSSSPRLVIRNGQIRGWSRNGIRVECPVVLEDLRVEECGELTPGQGGVRGNDHVSSQARRCVFAENLGDGLRIGAGSTVEECTAAGNQGFGVQLGEHSLIRNCVTRHNLFSGIFAGAGSMIADCVSSQNGFAGIGMEDRSTVVNCIASDNANVGILVANRCVVTQSRCMSSPGIGGTGIRATGQSNRIDGNSCDGLGIGIQCVGAANLITRNSCSGNATNWDIAANNICLVENATLAGAINGNSGGTPPGSTNPNANYTY